MSHITMLSVDEKTMASDLDRAGYKKMGITVKSATTYDDMIKLLSAHHIDIIVMNMDHTKIEILDAVKRIKRIKDFSEVPVVLTSVQSAPKIKQLALKSGADMFVEQPLPRDYFVEKIKSLLSQQTRGQQRVSGSVALTFNWNDRAHTCDVGDLSPTGILLFTDLSIPSGTLLELQITLGASHKPIKVKGEVVRHLTPDPARNGHKMGGIGIRFNQFSADGQQRIESWVARTSDTTNKLAYYL